MRVGMHDGHGTAESCKRLGELGADGSSANHDQSRRSLGEREDRLVGVVRRVGEAGDRWPRRPRAGRDDRPTEAQHRVVHRDRIGAAERGVAQEHIDAECAEALDAINGTDVGAQATEPRHDGAEVAFGGDARSAKSLGGGAGLAPRTGRPNHSFRGHAAEVEAIAAEHVPLDQRDARPEAGRDCCAHETRRAGTDHHEVIPILGHRRHPPLRRDRAHQLRVRVVEREQRNARGPVCWRGIRQRHQAEAKESHMCMASTNRRGVVNAEHDGRLIRRKAPCTRRPVPPRKK